VELLEVASQHLLAEPGSRAGPDVVVPLVAECGDEQALDRRGQSPQAGRPLPEHRGVRVM
jgi:hypothetical protein